MGKRRTKNQKQKTSRTRSVQTLRTPLQTKKKIYALDHDYDPKLLSSDLRKTILVSAIVLSGQLALYFFYFK